MLALFASPSSVSPNAAHLMFFPPDSYFSKSHQIRYLPLPWFAPHHYSNLYILVFPPCFSLPYLSQTLVSFPFFSLPYLSKTLLWRNCTYYSIILTISTVSCASWLISKFPFSSWRRKTRPASPPLMFICHISALISSYSQSVCFIDLALVIKGGVIFTFR